MAVNAISSNNIPAAPPVRSQQEAKPAADRPAEKQSAAPAPTPAPSVNTSGQTTGTRISTSA